MSKKNIILLVLLFFFCIFIGLFFYAQNVYSDVTTTLQEIHEPELRKVSVLRKDEIVLQKKIPFSLLILGVDKREGDKGRSDTILFLTVNPTSESIKMVSIPRDTYTEIIGKEIQDKINHAYAFGGIEMSVNTVENLLNVPIDYVIQIDMEGFKDIVDFIGGVTVNNDRSFQVNDTIFKEGEISLHGDQALDYVQMRKDDPRGDFGRQLRQKQVIQSLLKKGANFNILLKHNELLYIIEENIQTNMTFEQMLNIQKEYKKSINTIESLSFEDGVGELKNGIWYYMMNEDELNDISREMNEHLKM
ncbi:LCP family protein [Psychrobacillus sp. NPDC093200]|uniref:LCP family glycopolymer transferase n=1 Tax=Psychrobacillus sp. NPDC093200 TaxID=3390656 RepID=UPI003CFD5569